MNILSLHNVKSVSTTTVERRNTGDGSLVKYDSQTITVEMDSGDVFFIEMFFEKGEKK